ncbi:MAG: aminoacyl-tRNA hydrolase [Spirochaetaceae bacterium]|nr:MAG: aminoacyl-tRNA hydrolase [Spirochaetaceae bacterium]
MSTQNIRLCVFLGNPGRQYRDTRHNAGYLLAAYHPDFSGETWRTKFHADYLEVRSARSGVGYTAIRPTGFMNRSGVSVSEAATFFRISPEEMLVIHDDVELPFGRIGFRRGGGMAGHKGLRDISTRTGSQNYARLRIGISRPQSGPVQAHVLGRFNSHEQAALPELLEAASELFDDVLAQRVQTATDRTVFDF